MNGPNDVGPYDIPPFHSGVFLFLFCFKTFHYRTELVWVLSQIVQWIGRREREERKKGNRWNA